MNVRRHLPGALALLGLAALPLVADRLRSDPPRCEMDGVALDRAFRTRVRETSGATHAFCGVSCAESWLARRGTAPLAVLVTDGASGGEIEARNAWYVRTLLNVGDGAPDAIRVFARKEDALRHAKAHGGRVLVGAERPFDRQGAGYAQAEN